MRSTLLLATLSLSAAALPATAHAGWLSDLFHGIQQCRTNTALVPVLEAELATCEANLLGYETDLAAYEAELTVCFDDLAELDQALDACEYATKIVSARKGGIATSGDGLAFVSFPPGTLKSDTLVTVNHVPSPRVDTKRITDVYDFGPDRLEMGAEATICFELDAFQAKVSAAAGRDESCLGYFDERAGDWKCEDSCLDTYGDKGGLVCGTTDHFTNFALLLSGKDDGGECQSSEDSVGVLDQTLGGAVGLEDKSAFVNVPPHALIEDTEFTFNVIKNPVVDVARASAAVNVGPDGARFLKPITVCLEVNPKFMKDDACLAYLDMEAEGGPSWTCEDRAIEKGNDNLYCGQTDHLTVYAIALGL